MDQYFRFRVAGKGNEEADMATYTSKPRTIAPRLIATVVAMGLIALALGYLLHPGV